MTEQVRVRIAPSPTGDPHVGTAYVALFNYVFARQQSGKFILRIEDTDQTRSTPESEQAILASLRWLGLTWDEGPDVGGPYGPYRQSDRTDLYRAHADILIEKGAAYRCFCTPEQLAEMRVKGLKTGNVGYDRTCRHLRQEETLKRAESGEPHVIRLAFPLGGETSWAEPMRGTLSIANPQIDDQILIKSDGFPTYHLANVVDDHLMKISHVIRAEEWISSAPKHLFLYESFGWTPPQFVHMPLLRNADRSKISKRKNPVSLDYYRKAGFLPECLLNFLAMMGWTMADGREMFSVAEMTKEFAFERVSLGGPVLDLKKLIWLNGNYIRALESDALLARIHDEVLSDAYLRDILPLVQKRVETLDELVPYISFFFAGALDYDPDLLVFKIVRTFAKKGRKPDIEPSALVEELQQVFIKLHLITESLDGLFDFAHTTLEAHVRQLVEGFEWNTGQFFMLLRVALTGRPATPPLFETMEVLGRARVLRRLRTALALVEDRLMALGARPPGRKKLAKMARRLAG